jgi:hypothetical protein
METASNLPKKRYYEVRLVQPWHPISSLPPSHDVPKKATTIFIQKTILHLQKDKPNDVIV